MSKLTPEVRNSLKLIAEELQSIAKLRALLSGALLGLEELNAAIPDSDNEDIIELQDKVVSLIAASDAFNVRSEKLEGELNTLLKRPKLSLV